MLYAYLLQLKNWVLWHIHSINNYLSKKQGYPLRGAVGQAIKDLRDFNTLLHKIYHLETP